MSKRDRIWLGITWLTSILLVNPVGDFPLNDDWGYAQVVRHLLETGEYYPGEWPVMTLFTQVWWGAAFAGPLGFSFTVLRFSTLVLAILGSYWLFQIMARDGRHRLWAWTATLLLIWNPLYFNLGFSFMTDVPFTVFVIASIALFRKVLETDHPWAWLSATVLTIAATLIRQPGLLIALAFGLAALAFRPSWRSLVWVSLSTGLTYGALLWYIHFVGLQGETPGAVDSFGPLLRRLRFPLFPELLARRGGMILFYQAVFLSPLLLLHWSRRPLDWMIKTKIERRLTWLSTLLTLIFGFASWTEVPAGNIIDFFGLGPTTLFGVDQRDVHTAALPYLIWPLLKGLGYVAVFYLIRCVLSAIIGVWRSMREWSAKTYWKLGLGLLTLAYSLFLLLERIHFDRYQLVLVPALLLLFPTGKPLGVDRAIVKYGTLLLLLLLGVFSIGATHNHLHWNRVRWRVLNDLVQQQNIPPTLIDGGPEFNGWYRTAPQNPFSFTYKSWWFVNEDQFVLTFSPEIDCSVEQTAHPINCWWPGRDTLYVHRRPAPVQRDTIFCDLEQLTADSSGLVSNLPDYTLANGPNRTTGKAHSGRFAFRLTPGQPYAGMLRLSPVHPCEAITISAWRLGNNRSAGIVAAAPDVDVLHTFQNSFEEAQGADGWHRVRHEMRLPADYDADRLDIYLWNPVNDTVWMDDIQVVWRRSDVPEQ